MKLLFALFLLCMVPFTAQATETPYNIVGQPVIYNDGETVLEGYYVASRCSDLQESYPTVMIIHQWKGLTDNEKMRAEMLSRQCYNAFAIDMYGKDVRPTTNEDAGKEATKYKSNPELALSRMQAALNYLNVRPHIDTNNIAAIGYCFGGTMVLDLARSGADIKAVSSFHGGLSTSMENYNADDVKATISVHHGADDPMVKESEVANFKTEMDDKKLSYNFTAYDNAVHAFTQIESGTDNSKGAAYNLQADRESWASLLTFLNEQFTAQSDVEEEMEIKGKN